ncbi:hypothetical protein CDL15_Pgr019194 [Punica granatum]|uniref:Uncharacterized protein n=1 Tax=Punica granatum TaxID=22663 RepID=A0A218W579_PUNGR|nr:hypothetical protein CDL15_Pgr019194 [Punica granatum]
MQLHNYDSRQSIRIFKEVSRTNLDGGRSKAVKAIIDFIRLLESYEASAQFSSRGSKRVWIYGKDKRQPVAEQPAAAAAVATSPIALALPPGSGRKASALSRAKRQRAFFAVSLLEGFCYIKALLLGQENKMTARNEKEAAEADLWTYKMQVDAANATEDAKKKLNKTA